MTLKMCVHMAVAVPGKCVNEDSTLKDVPVVFKYYTLTHARAAVCDSVSWHGQVTEFDESWDTVQHSEWRGLRMHALLAMVPEMQRTIAVDFYAAKTIDQVLSQQRHTFQVLCDKWTSWSSVDYNMVVHRVRKVEQRQHCHRW